MVEADDWTGLPAELLCQVFRLLPISDLRSVMLVCKRWGEAGGMPSVWASVNIVVTRINLAAMPKVLGSPRLMLVKELGMSAVSTKMIEALERHPGIRKVDMEDTCLSGIQPRLLVQALSNLEHVNLTGTQLSVDQVTDLCSSLLDGTIRLRSLSFAWNDLSLLEPTLLAKAVSMVVDVVDLRNSCLTTEQTEAIFEAIANACQPRKICMRHNDMSEADADILARGAHKVEEVDLRHTSLTLHQVITILGHSLLDTKLRRIELGFVEVYCREDAKLLNKLIVQTKFVILVNYERYNKPEFGELGELDYYSSSDESDDDSLYLENF